MQYANETIPVANAIQQAIAPVFLLVGVGTILNVLSSRLGRVIDRFRKLNAIADDKRGVYQAEITILLRRRRWNLWAIFLCTVCALLVCIVIAILFIGFELNKDPSTLISMFFVAAMFALTAGLLCFLREIGLATGSIK